MSNQKIIIYPFYDFVPETNDSFIIGSFESFHIGHNELYKKMLATSNNGRKIIVTFSNDDLPLAKKDAFTDKFAKYFTLSQLDIDAIVELKFSEIGLMEGDLFLKKLTNNLPVNIFVGKDFKFGKGALYSSNDIQNILTNANVFVLETVKENNLKISTSKLKEKIAFGEIDSLNDYLVSNYTISFLVDSYNEIVSENKKYINLHPGVYAGIFYDKKIAFYGFLHISKNNQLHYYLVDNEEYELSHNSLIYFEFVSTIRLIKTNSEDQITEKDINLTREKFVY